ncbi:hypothetical protein [Mongoliibacter ruber]|uniref:CHU domain-containing protein n=1 Tax=Mongoliibacter ruber TaxID=1750599 RepID=A0A2T0WFF0_9BACT|nr:hypothetical protein [Mongoliibacter ruber]PRY85438.1 hypothetical protein CLW00_11219 [Mongoliibacter ruber]
MYRAPIYTVLLLCSLFFLIAAAYSSDYKGRDIIEYNDRGKGFFFNDPNLEGPERLCIVFGSVTGEFSAGGIVESDRYEWSATNPSGVEFFEFSGRGENYETVPIRFSELGANIIQVTVIRAGVEIYSETRTVQVTQGPELVLMPDYLLCGNDPTTVQAIPNTTPQIDQYTFEWTNAAGVPVGNTNELTVTQEGPYFISLFFTNSEGGQDCLITGSTYVGPPDDFTLSIQQDEACEGEFVQVTADTPFRGDWTVLKQGETQRLDLGNSFSLTIDTENDLDGPGNYTVFFSVANPQNPACSSERSIPFSIKEGPKYSAQNQQAASTCDANDGSFEILTESTIDEIRIIELNEARFNFPAGEVLLFENIPSGIYTIETKTNDCFRTGVVIVPSMAPLAGDVFEVTPLPESCNNVGVEEGKLLVTFVNGIVEGEYRIVTGNGGEVKKEPIPNQNQFEIDGLPGDFYVLEIIDQAGCTIPWDAVLDVQKRERVSFSVPNNINICEVFELLPSTEEDLEFELLLDGNTVEIKNAGNVFELTESGDYSIIGRERRGTPDKCPRRINFSANVSEQLDFDVVLADQDCFGNRAYEADLSGRDPESVVIRWFNEDGDIVGRGKNWLPVAFGRFFLEVQPRGSGFCAVDPVEFTVEEPVLSVEIELEVEPFCPDSPFTVISFNAERELIADINWIFIDPDGNVTDLTQFDGQDVITAEEEGTYEVLIFNEFGCELGNDLVLILRSTDDSRPEVNEFYSVCDDINFGETIRPGQFDEYEWYFEGGLVSSDSIFKPQVPGEYTLVVTNPDGCTIEERFVAFEDCEFQYVFPTGMVLSDPDKLFEIYVNDAIENAQVWIHNRQGQLIFYCEDFNVQTRVPFCQWDGVFGGDFVPTGTYTVTLSYKSEKFGVSEKVVSSLVVLQ